MAEAVAASLKCWICGQEGNTGEHLIKASDLRSLFGDSDAKSPLYIHTNTVRNRPVQGVKANVLKSPARICPDCNNARTQPNDRAWATLSEALHARAMPIRPGMVIHPKGIFKNDATAEMLNVHLFLAKLFGCRICADEVPIDVSGFSQAILTQQAHPNLYIKFGCASWTGDQKTAGNSEVRGHVVGDECVGAGWFYHVGDFAVCVMYAKDGVQLNGMVNSWHPKLGRNWFVLDGFAAE